MFEAMRESPQGIMLNIKVIPRAKRDEVVGIENEAVKIRLNAPPVEGKANEALIRFLSEMLGIPKAKIELVRGETSRHKVVRVTGITLNELKLKLGLEK